MKRGYTPLASLAIAALTLTACGGDDDNNDDGGTDTTVAAEVTSPATDAAEEPTDGAGTVGDITIPDVSLPGDLTVPASMPDFNDIMTRMQELPPEQLSCLSEQMADFSGADLGALVDIFEGCGVDYNELMGG